MKCRFDYMHKKSMSYISETEFLERMTSLVRGNWNAPQSPRDTPGVGRFGTIAIPIIYLQLYSTCKNGVIQHSSLYVPREFWRNLGNERWRNWLIRERTYRAFVTHEYPETTETAPTPRGTCFMDKLTVRYQCPYSILLEFSHFYDHQRLVLCITMYNGAVEPYNITAQV